MSFEGCATTTAASTENTSNTNNKSSEVKLRFDDWKYKGFGKELPYWAEAAADSNTKYLKKNVPELNNAKKVIVLRGYGENSDQAVKAAENLYEEQKQEDSTLKLFDTIWVRQDINYKKTEMPYISMYVLYKD